MSKMHLRQPADHEKLWFTSSVCGSFNRNKKRNTKIYRNKRFTIYLSKQLHKGYFQHGMADGDIKDLTRRTASDKILGVIKHLIFLKILKIRYQGGLATLIYIFFGKKSSGGSAMLANKSAAHIENISNK